MWNPFKKVPQESGNNQNKVENNAPKNMTQQEMVEAYGRASYEGYKTGQWNGSIRIFQELEDAGFAEASVALGQYASMNSRELARFHFMKAADKSAEAAWGYAGTLGHQYIADIDGDDSEWYHYCLQSAKGGCPDAMNELGNMYNRIDHYLGAFYWYYMGAFYEHHQGWSGATGLLGKWQKMGMPELEKELDGVNQEEILCVRRAVDSIRNKSLNMKEYMILSLSGDNEFGGLFAGQMFEGSNNWPMAKQAFQVAAHSPKSIMAKKCLGDMLAYGKGCQQDISKAFEWYEAAAEMGEKSACFIYAQNFVIKNPAEAVYWFARSYRRGYEPAFNAILERVKM